MVVQYVTATSSIVISLYTCRNNMGSFMKVGVAVYRCIDPLSAHHTYVEQIGPCWFPMSLANQMTRAGRVSPAVRPRPDGRIDRAPQRGGCSPGLRRPACQGIEDTYSHFPIVILGLFAGDVNRSISREIRLWSVPRTVLHSTLGWNIRCLLCGGDVTFVCDRGTFFRLPLG